ncbi:hypothetical protein NPIL_488431 [Nephila pilipes]|uniref:Secreted protein n=1 Tax=Nephila pilipes TaxID=299642 RepID=A0A8X6P3S9_NEPPI|nr:hypothetical protein NPIL_488431 [Nephila pilipes]
MLYDVTALLHFYLLLPFCTVQNRPLPLPLLATCKRRRALARSANYFAGTMHCCWPKANTFHAVKVKLLRRSQQSAALRRLFRRTKRKRWQRHHAYDKLAKAPYRAGCL